MTQGRISISRIGSMSYLQLLLFSVLEKGLNVISSHFIARLCNLSDTVWRFDLKWWYM